MNYNLQAYIKKDDGVSVATNLKTLFPGVYVLEAKGLADFGKAKNIVTESYAEGDGLRHWEPSDGVIHREATDVTLKLLFTDEGGTNRYVQYDNFITYVEKCAVFYWDSVRRRRAKLLFVEKSSPRENFHGGIVYIEAEVKFKNVDGFSTQLAKWSFSWSKQVCVKVLGLNNGYARCIKLTITNSESSIPYEITSAFGSQEAITDEEYAALDDSEFNTRLSAFNTFVFSDMATNGYIDFADDLDNITSDCQVSAPLTCPVQ